MPFQAVADTVSVVYEYTYHGIPVANVLHYYDNLEVLEDARIDALANVSMTLFQAALQPYLSSDLTLVRIVATNEDVEAGYQHVELPVTSGQCTNGAGLPGNVAMVLSLRTAYRGRSHRGRIYLPGIPEASVVGNQFLSGFTSYINLWAQALMNPGNIGFSLAVASRVHNSLPRVVGFSTPVTSITFDSKVDSQRRRLH